MNVFLAMGLLLIIWTVAVAGQYIMCYFHGKDAWWYIIYTSLIGSAATFYIFWTINEYIAGLIQ